jgi:hypothetical protein
MELRLIAHDANQPSMAALLGTLPAWMTVSSTTTPGVDITP